MYCKHCGKEIADGSKFCQHCGKSQGSSGCPFVNRSVWIIYLIWTIANFYFLTGEKPYISRYPRTSIWDRNFYSFNDFVILVFIFPAIMYIVYRFVCIIRKRFFKK